VINPLAVLQAIPIIFIGKYGFSTSHEGLIFIGIGIGTAIGALINWRATSHYPKLIEKWKGFPPPEERLYGSMIGSPVLVIGIFWLGWTGNYPSVPWYVPALSTIFVGIGISLIFMSFLVCLVLFINKPSTK
jgi:DHA1 family multidrug resistance protein-like MFS transporter